MHENSKAFLAIWHDLLDEGKIDWEKWHTYEHMPERIGIPGFLGGRRYMNHNDQDQCCFTIYEGSDLSVFKSAPYLKRLNNPTSWTKKSAATFRNFTRGACKRVSFCGPQNGYGGVVMTIRLLRDDDFSENSQQLDQLTTNINEMDGVITTTLGLCDTQITSTETTEQKLRKGTTEVSLDGVLIIEGYDTTVLEEQTQKILRIISSADIHLDPVQNQIYSLSNMLIA